ncbi:MAG: hypothetical protein QG579_398 [Patescibacteria group bacterium]|jgi:hypothetical protein|nr:hypothetical protein [Patescibacteria group bacterium]
MNEGIDPIKLPTDVEKAREEILYIRQECLRMGANDSESSRFDEVLEKLMSGEYSPKKAIEVANSILNGKQDYH